MTQWEYVKGSEADFEGAPEWATTIRQGLSTNVFYENKDFSGRWMNKTSTFSGTNGYREDLPLIAERRKVDNLQSRVNDANLEQLFDTVQRPAHYNQSGIECIDAIAASMTPAEFQAYLKGNVQKYLWRYQHKNGVEDCRKAQWYLDRLVKELSK